MRKSHKIVCHRQCELQSLFSRKGGGSVGLMPLRIDASLREISPVGSSGAGEQAQPGGVPSGQPIP